MKPTVWVAALIAAGVVWAPLAPAGATEDVSPTQLVILHDVPDDGYTYVGNTVQFGYLILTPEGEPTVHKDGKIRVVQNGVVMFETHGMASAHDYDAMNLFTMTFTVPGPYTVFAEAPYEGLSLAAEFSGTVWPLPEDAVAARFDAEATGATNGFDMDYSVMSGDRLINHSDAIVELRDASGRLLFRTHTHTHAAPMEATFAFESAALAAPGQSSAPATVRLIGYNAFPSKSGAHFGSIVATVEPPQDVFVPEGPPTAPPAPTDVSPEAKNYGLYASYDPDRIVSPYGNIRLNAIVLDRDSGAPVPHVNFHSVLAGPLNSLIFESSSLHEYDGVYEIVFTPTRPGVHTGWIEASQGEWSDVVEFSFNVTPVGLPLAAGPVVVIPEGLDDVRSGQPTSIDFTMQTQAGTPVMHSEIEFQIAREEWGVPLIWNKLHTHGDGRMGFDFTFPEPGRYWLHIDPETLEGEPATSYDFYEPGAGRALLIDVAPGPPLPVPSLPDSEEILDGDADVPGPSAALAVLAVAAAAVLAIRRRP